MFTAINKSSALASDHTLLCTRVNPKLSKLLQNKIKKGGVGGKGEKEREGAGGERERDKSLLSFCLQQGRIQYFLPMPRLERKGYLSFQVENLIDSCLSLWEKRSAVTF